MFKTKNERLLTDHNKSHNDTEVEFDKCITSVASDNFFWLGHRKVQMSMNAELNCSRSFI